MSKTAHSQSPANTVPARVLAASGIFWFLVAATGQIIFIWFIADFYGTRTLTGNFEAWNTKPLIDGFKEGDTPGNLMFAAHVLLAAVMTGAGLLQLVPQIRRRVPAFHRWTGRVFITLALVLAVGGLWLVWVRGTYLSMIGAVSITGDAVLIIVFSLVTIRFAMARKIDLHHRWALRTFMVASSVWFLRVMIMAWVLIMGGPVGMNQAMNGPVDIVFAFGQYLIPLAILELYLWARRSGGPSAKLIVAAVVCVATLVMAVGIAGAYMGMWAPYM